MTISINIQYGAAQSQVYNVDANMVHSSCVVLNNTVCALNQYQVLIHCTYITEIKQFSSTSQFSNLIGHLHGSKSHSVIPPQVPLHSAILSVIALNLIVYCLRMEFYWYRNRIRCNITENKTGYDSSMFL